MDYTDILTKLENVKGGGDQHTARCPAHDDKNNSLSIAKGQEGQTLFNCHAGCKATDIAAALDLSMSDLFPAKISNSGRNIVATYDYHDENGKMVFQKVRYSPKGFTQRQPDGKGGHIYNLKGIEKPPLYRLPDVLKAVADGKAVYIVEGEKDVDSLRAKGKVATCGHLGAGVNKWLPHYSEYLRDSHVIIIPDNDSIGKTFAEDIAQKLLTVAKSVRPLDLTAIVPDLPEHGDISDILSMNDIDGVAELDGLAKTTTEYNPPESSGEEIAADTAEDEPDSKQTQAGTLLQLVESSGATFFHNDAGEPYATIPVSGHNEIYPIDGKAFKIWLNGMFYKATKKPINNEAIGQAIATLSAKALFDSSEPVTLHTRIAGDAGGFLYDLANPSWQAVQITLGNWKVSDNPPIIFNRYSHQAAQAMPIPGGDMTKILEYVPIKENPLLFYCWLVSAFIPGIPHPMPVFYGEKGAAKTTTCELLKSLIDPSALKTITLQNDPRTLAVNLQQHWFLPFDNVSFINEDTSDTLCRAVTGGGIQQRKLFTNAEDTIFTFQRVLAINGINNVATRADLLDRAILVELRRISEDGRKELSAVQTAFEADKPAILGGIFDTLADAMEIYPTVKLNRLPRMADFTRWGYAIGEALSNGGGAQFLEEYTANRDIQNQEAIASDPVATLIVAFMESRAEWSGTTASLYKALEWIAPEHGINIRTKAFPADPTRLSKRLNGIRSNLEGAGISFEKRKTNGTINICLYRESENSYPSRPSDQTRIAEPIIQGI